VDRSAAGFVIVNDVVPFFPGLKLLEVGRKPLRWGAPFITVLPVLIFPILKNLV
jgi:hypothetical protein